MKSEFMKKTLAIFFLFTFPLGCFGFQKSPDLKVRLSLAERKISKNKETVIKATIRVSNISKKSVLIVVDELVHLSYQIKKRELGLNFWRDYSEFDYRMSHLKLLKSNEHLS